MLTQIAEAIALGAVNKGIAIAAALRDQGLYLTGALFAWFLATRGLKLAADSRDSLGEFFGDFIEKLVYALIVFWVLETAIYAQFIKDWLWEAFRTLALKAAGFASTIPGTGALGALEEALDRFQDGVIGALVKAQDSLSGGSNPISAALNYLKAHLWTLIVAGIVIVILAIAKALAVGAFCVGAVTFGVGAALGPLFIPLILSERLSAYFWSWFRFMIVSAATLLVAVIVVLLLAESLKPLAGPGGSVSNEWSFLLGSLSLNDLNFVIVATKAIVIAIFLAFVLSQIPEITNALFSGSTAGVRSGAGPVMRAMTGGARQGISRAIAAASGKPTPRPPPRPPPPPTPAGPPPRGTSPSGAPSSPGGGSLGGVSGVSSFATMSSPGRASANGSAPAGAAATHASDRSGSSSVAERSGEHLPRSDKDRTSYARPGQSGELSTAFVRENGLAHAAASGGGRDRMQAPGTLHRQPVTQAGEAPDTSTSRWETNLDARDASFDQAAGARDRTTTQQQDGWLERSTDGTPIANSPEAVAQAALAGDPEAQRIAQMGSVIAQARETDERRRAERLGRRSLKRVEVKKGDEDKA